MSKRRELEKRQQEQQIEEAAQQPQYLVLTHISESDAEEATKCMSPAQTSPREAAELKDVRIYHKLRQLPVLSKVDELLTASKDNSLNTDPQTSERLNYNHKFDLQGSAKLTRDTLELTKNLISRNACELSPDDRLVYESFNLS